jgi:hypothetical protein
MRNIAPSYSGHIVNPLFRFIISLDNQKQPPYAFILQNSALSNDPAGATAFALDQAQAAQSGFQADARVMGTLVTGKA